jgi:endonuclease-3
MPKKRTAKKIKFKVDKTEAAERVKKIWPILKKTYPNAKIALKFKNPLQLLIATILSAQCTDKQVNVVTKNVFKKYKSAAVWANTELSEIA